MIQKILAFLKSLFTSIPAKQDPALSPPSKMKTISHIPVYGEESDAVKIYQAALVSAGEDPGPIDGKFWTLTRAATSRLQKKNGLEGSGYPGELTMQILGLEVLGSAPVVGEPVTGNFAPLSWEKSDPKRKVWSDYLIQRIDAAYESHVLKVQDWHRFRSDWNDLTRAQRVNVMAEVISATAKYESGWNPKSASVDVGTKEKRDTWSVGLMQVSVVDQDWAKPSGKDRYSYDELLTPIPNLDLTLAILFRQISRTGLLILPNSSKYRYWAVLLSGGRYEKIDEITGAVRSFKVLTSSEKPETPTPIKPVIPPASGPSWYRWAKQFQGKHESDKGLQAILKGMARRLFGFNWGDMTTSTWAWCGLGAGAALMAVGLSWQTDGHMARNWGKYGDEIVWRRDGIPRGAKVWINHGLNCKSTSGNHIADADGDCAPEDLKSPSDTINLYGANQSNAWKVSTYRVAEICAVRWPSDAAERPYKVTKSVNCTSGASGSESTR